MIDDYRKGYETRQIVVFWGFELYQIVSIPSTITKKAA